MATPESKRQAPDRELDNYVAHIKRLINGTEPPGIEDDKFLSPNFISDGTTLTPASLSNIPLGFNVKINGITYSDVHISGYGFLVLQEPGNSFSMIDVSTSSDEFRNNLLKATWRVKHVLIAPWWDVCSVPPKDIDTLSTLGLYTTLTPQMIEDIKFGKDVKNWPFHPYDRGVRYKKIYDYTNGVGFIVRWTNLNSSLEVIKFEACIFENGKIQFKYWPTKKYENAPSAPTSIDTRSATVGVFYCGFGNYKFRDFAPTIDYQKEKRLLNELGGASYDPSYSDSGQFYSLGIKTDRWPGPAIISFDPPKNPGKFLPRKNSSFISSNKQLTRVGFFDDRKTFNFVSSMSISDKKVVHMPSLLPNRLTGDTSPFINGDTRQLLFTNGSITVASGTTTNSIIDSQIEMLDALDSVTKIESDYSFNEFKQNYLVTKITSSFYTNEDSVEKFGEKFTYPLKSKTKFNISLPVEKQIQMDPYNPSFFWYNNEKKTWQSTGESAPIPEIYINYYNRQGMLGLQYSGENDVHRYNRIVETSIGFDAVGRKISSGSWYNNVLSPMGPLYPQFINLEQKSLSIGCVLNSTGNDGKYQPIANSYASIGKNSPSAVLNNAFEKSYENSITDSIALFPNNSQQISLNNDYPFLIEKIVATIPLKIQGNWFKDITTCNKAYVKTDIPGSGGPPYTPNMSDEHIGPIDFGGPGITFAIHSPKKSGSKTYLDLIVSGTITHETDMKYQGAVVFEGKVMANGEPDPSGVETGGVCVRPIGFRSFSKPTVVIDGPQFEGDVKLEMEAAISSGITIAKNIRSEDTTKIVNQLTAEFINPFGETNYIADTGIERIPPITPPPEQYGPGRFQNSNECIYLQQVTPLSRGTSKFEFSGNSILGPTIGFFNSKNLIKNPLYVKKEDLAPILVPLKGFVEVVAVYSIFNSKQSPYLIMPGEKLSISISKTRSIINSVDYTGFADVPQTYYNVSDTANFGNYKTFGDHETVLLNTGSINLTIYGSYVAEGSEYHT